MQKIWDGVAVMLIKNNNRDIRTLCLPPGLPCHFTQFSLCYPLRPRFTFPVAAGSSASRRRACCNLGSFSRKVPCLEAIPAPEEWLILADSCCDEEWSTDCLQSTALSEDKSEELEVQLRVKPHEFSLIR